jgi:2,4-dienoyl-CoA reductase-like NADH-dependent reductase (Old Yellow Enzyme family)
MTSPFEPYQLGPVTLRNRFIKSATNEAMSIAGAPTRAMVKHHADLAAGGVGLTTVAYGAVSPVGRTLPNQLVLARENLEDLKALADAVHANGGKISMQMTHGGSFVTGIKVKGRTMSASSGLNKAGLMAGNFLRRAMNEQDMRLVTDEFVDAAKLLREAGFDALEIHMGHGYLLNQFISPLDNRRSDEFGGPAENRVRFPARVLAAVSRAVGDDLAVLAKVNVTDGNRRGARAEDAIVTARALQDAGAHMIVLSGGRNVESSWLIFGSKMNTKAMNEVLGRDLLSRFGIRLAAMSTPENLEYRPLYFRKYSLQVREAVDVPLAYLGGAATIEDVRQVMDDGFECVAMARALINNAQLVNKFENGELTQSGCRHCNACVAYIYHPAGTRCIQNPPNDLALNQLRASAKV